MPFSPGTRLGHYEVIGPLGEGGMGVVYRAHDTTLDRTVALKLLPEAFAHDPDRLARFDREAKMLASLNHPFIAQIYGVQEAADSSSGAIVRALVMELVEGPTLDERLLAARASGSVAGLPLDEVLPIARQLADALEAAHEQGIVHRDLKPSNIKVRADGTVKVLDFGLAKLAAGDGGRDSRDALTASPTITSPMLMTGAGVILGTAAYMAPEQARGKIVDKRADIWAFGCVLYEVLTGQRAFGGEDVADTMVAILSREPDWSALSREADTTLGPLLRRCLVKDPKRRLRDIGEARLLLDGHVDGNIVADSGPQPAAVHRPSFKQLLPWVAASVIVAAAAAAAVALMLRARNAETIPVRATILLPEGARPSTTGFGAQHFAISPDGRTIALILSDAEGQRHLWTRSLDSLSVRMLRGTDGAIAPFWSPDSRWIAFATDGKLQRVEVGGGLPVTICTFQGNALGFSAGTWARDGTVLFSTLGSAGIWRAAAEGGDAVAVTHLDAARGELNHSQVSFLPDGRHFLYYAGGQGEPIGLFVGSLDSPKRVRLLERGSRARYAAGHLFFTRDKDLVAQPFNIDRLALEGDVVPVADAVSVGGALSASGAFSVSTDGVVLYQGVSVERRVRLEWFDRTGARVGALSDEGLYSEPELSPDGSRTAFVIGANDATPGADIWIYDNVRGTRTRLTSGPGGKVAPRWSPDSRSLAFAWRRVQGARGGWLRIKPLAAAEDAPLVDDDENRGVPSSWSRDNRFLLFTGPSRGGDDRRTRGDIWLLPLTGERKPAKYIAAPFNESGAVFSPDVQHVAYQSDASGRYEVYVTTFPTAIDPVTISTTGGRWPQWRQDGRELFYFSLDGQVMAVDVSPGSPLRFGTPHALFKMTADGASKPYSPSPDGQRFIVATTVGQGDVAPLTVLVRKW